ncbi:MFS transporter [Bifidobacterium sp. 64T4]|uniref:MFS transporter n=1 Tax=Bifidobacterium pongonis TaxID=2834432 RepID=UPI001C58FEE0|nr:MFS transporter [Bifidobacterium pongonis]MBW3095167.1 MFS transporter [Bifidobacterium pongonis]
MSETISVRPVSSTNKWRFTGGFLAFAVLSGAAFYMTMSVLVPQRLRDIGIANSTAVLGSINAAGSIASIFIALFIGALSDRTASRWGKRTPWIFAGAFIYGFCFWALSRPQSALIIGIIYVLALVGLNMVQAPIYARISDQVEESARATVSAAIGAGGVIGQGIGTLIGSSLIEHMELGFVCAGLCALAAGVLSVVIAPREPSSKDMPKETGKPLWRVVAESLVPPLKNCADFYRAFICRTCLIVAYQMVFSYQLYILQDHIGETKLEAAASIQVISVITMIVSIVASLAAGPIADALHRRKAPIVVACCFFAVGLAMPWIFPTQMGMFLFGGIASFGYGMYLSVDQALNVDVLPDKKTAGKDLGFMNIATCAGQAIGVAITSTIVSVFGSYVFVFPTAIVMTAVAAISVLSIKRVR